MKGSRRANFHSQLKACLPRATPSVFLPLLLNLFPTDVDANRVHLFHYPRAPPLPLPFPPLPRPPSPPIRQGCSSNSEQYLERDQFGPTSSSSVAASRRRPLQPPLIRHPRPIQHPSPHYLPPHYHLPPRSPPSPRRGHEVTQILGCFNFGG